MLGSSFGQLSLEPKRSAPKKGSTAVARDPKDEDKREEAWLLCRFCQARVAPQDAVFSMRASGSVQVFPNPMGEMRVIVTLRTAENLAAVGEPTAEYTWFAGYTWQIVVCAGCRSHLGWHYRAFEAGEPSSFFGLLESGLIKSD